MLNCQIREHIHLEDRNDVTIRVNITTSFEQIFCCFDGIQYDDNLAKDVKGQDIPCRLLLFGATLPRD
jgi:hypothetical protein